MPPVPQNLPAQLTPLIGRRAEREAITRLLSQPTCRLLTLLGPGGIGKTRLAMEIAHWGAERFADGVFWVDLQPGHTADFLVTAVTDVLPLSLSGGDDPARQLHRYLADKTILLVLDNFEQLLDSADFLSRMSQEAPGVKLLVTSRAALHLREEWLYPLSGLPYPSPDEAAQAGDQLEAFAAVRLFVERVRRVRPDFSPEEERADLLRICRLTEGTPLALELAASWARSLNCAAIAAEIERNLSFLTSNLRNVPQRHRSMQAVFNHSWALLTPAEQVAFPQLAVFRGGFRREAAEAVAGATLPLLTALVDKSLLHWRRNGRYQMHELLRQHGQSRLPQSDEEAIAIRRRHAAYYLDFLQQRSEAMLGGRQRETADEIAPELDNIRAAWRWAVQHQMVEEIGHAIEPLAMFFHFKGRYLEAARLYDEALQALAFPNPSTKQFQALLLLERGWIAIRLGQFEAAEQAFDEGRDLQQRFDLAPPPGQGTDPLLGLGILASIRGDYAAAETLVQQARDTAAAQNHPNNLPNADYQLASIAYARGDYEKAQAHAQAAYTACQQTGDRWFMAYCLNEMGRAARALGDYAAAQRHFAAGYELRESFSDPEGMALSLLNLGDVALRRQEIEEAGDLLGRSAAIYRQINDQGGLAAAYNGLGKTAVAQEDYETAREQLRRALTIAGDIRFTPLLLAILTAVAQFLLQTNRIEGGLALLALVEGHPAADQETKTAAQRQLRRARSAISPALFAATETPPDLETAVAAAQTSLVAPIPPPGENTLPPAPPPTALVEPLTERELEVLHLIAQGLTNRQIAERLTVVVGTVKAHNNSIYGKLAVRNRVQATARARELGLIP